MLIVMAQKAFKEQVDKVVAEIEARGYTAWPIPGGERVSIGVLNNKGPVDASLFTGLPGVKEVIPVTRPYKLVGREFQLEDTVVRVGEVSIGGGQSTVIGGPCAVESESQVIAHR